MVVSDLGGGGVLGNGAVNVRDNDFVVPVPQVDGAFAAARALVLCGDAKCHIIRPLLQFQTGLVTERKQNSEAIWRQSQFYSLTLPHMCSSSI